MNRKRTVYLLLLLIALVAVVGVVRTGGRSTTAQDAYSAAGNALDNFRSWQETGSEQNYNQGVDFFRVFVQNCAMLAQEEELTNLDTSLCDTAYQLLLTSKASAQENLEMLTQGLEKLTQDLQNPDGFACLAEFCQAVQEDNA